MRWALPFILFWVIICVGREELGFKGIAITVLIWIGLLLGCLFLNSPRLYTGYVFAALQSLMDAILIIVIFRGDIFIR